MLHKKLKVRTVLLCAALLIGATGCKTTPTVENEPDEIGTSVTENQENNVDGTVGQPAEQVTPKPEVSEAITSVQQNEATESAERTATVTLSDDGIVINGSGCKADGNQLKIKEAGTYEINGTLSNGSIYVNVDNESEVHLILNGVAIHNETSAALFCKKAAKVTVTLAEGSVNTLSDGASYVFEEGEDEPDATLYAKHDLVINGSGKLTVTSAYGDAIKGKDALYILGGEIVVDAADDGIVGRDLLYIADGIFTVTAAGDGLKASNDTDATLGNIVIDGGTFDLDTSDDALHCNASMNITGGDFLISSGDDGMHADGTLSIAGNGKIRITKSYEGIEALEILISGGEIDIVASDDGLNAAGGADGSGFGHPGAGMFGEGQGEVTITGGMLTVNASGDGLDSNGNLTLNGGTVRVFGPTSGGNGVLDYGGTFCLNGGTLFGAGTSDMAQTPANSSGQYSVAAVLTSAAQAGSTVTIVVDGETVISEEVPKRFNYIVASSKEFTEDAAVSVVVNGSESYVGALTDVVTCFGMTGSMGGFGGMGGFGSGFGGMGGFGSGFGGMGGFGGNKGNKPGRR